ncbi:MAG TPA: ATP-dependent DNA ligase, partial [Actinomycetota bacterium]|nr:ATP-dependent DNA ligase [Actinomycetota bacterium]
MPARKEILEVTGHEVTISNPDKVYFPRTGHTKLDLVRYYL